MRRIDAEQLRLTIDEALTIADMRGLSLTPEDGESLFSKTEGWAAGIVLMLEHAKALGEVTTIPEMPTPPVIFDYLAGEIFEKFEADSQDFLLSASFLPRMTVQMATSLTQYPEDGSPPDEPHA